MADYKVLDRESMTIEQKIGMLLCTNLNHGEKDLENVLQMIREHRL